MPPLVARSPLAIGERAHHTPLGRAAAAPLQPHRSPRTANDFSTRFASIRTPFLFQWNRTHKMVIFPFGSADLHPPPSKCQRKTKKTRKQKYVDCGRLAGKRHRPSDWPQFSVIFPICFMHGLHTIRLDFYDAKNGAEKCVVRANGWWPCY